MMAVDDLTKVIKKIEGYREEAVRLEEDLTAMPALGPENGGEGEAKKAEYLQSYLERMGLSVRRYDAPDKRVPSGYRPNMIAVLEGRRPSPVLWIMSHTDVVPPGDLSKWTGDPWKVRVVGDKLIGRGVEDNQQGTVSSILTVKAFKEAGVVPEIPIGLVIVADEETGSSYGINYVLGKCKNLFDKKDLIIIPDAGNPKGSMIEVAEKSILWIKFTTLGRQTHGSTPEKGVNAHRAGCYLATRLDTLYYKFRKKDQVFDPPISTFEPTKKEANVPNVNTIPGEDVIYFDCRVLPCYKLTEVIRAVRRIVRDTEKKFRVKIKMEFPQMESAAPPTPVDAPVAKAIERAMKSLRKKRTKTMGIGGGTVAKFFRDAGFYCAVWSTMDETAHNPDESARIPFIMEDAKIFAHIALQG